MELAAVSLTIVSVLVVASALAALAAFLYWGAACALRFLTPKNWDRLQYTRSQVIALGVLFGQFLFVCGVLNWGRFQITSSSGWEMVTTGRSAAFMADSSAQLTIAWGVLGIAAGLILLAHAVRKCRLSLFMPSLPSTLPISPTGAMLFP